MPTRGAVISHAGGYRSPGQARAQPAAGPSPRFPPSLASLSQNRNTTSSEHRRIPPHTPNQPSAAPSSHPPQRFPSQQRVLSGLRALHHATPAPVCCNPCKRAGTAELCCKPPVWWCRRAKEGGEEQEGQAEAPAQASHHGLRMLKVKEELQLHAQRNCVSPNLSPFFFIIFFYSPPPKSSAEMRG